MNGITFVGSVLSLVTFVGCAAQKVTVCGQEEQTPLERTSVTMSLVAERNEVHAGEPIMVKIVIHNGSHKSIQVQDAVQIIDYYTIMFDAGNGELAEASSQHEALCTDGKKEMNLSIACQPLIEIKVSDRSKIKIDLHLPPYVSELTEVVPGQTFERRLDIGQVISGTGEFAAIGRLNQPTNELWSGTFPIRVSSVEEGWTFTPVRPGPRIRNPVLRLSSRPITIRVLTQSKGQVSSAVKSP